MEAVICQSCGMPMQREEDFGTEEDFSKCKEYCRFCYRKGRFTKPDMTMEDMIKHVARMFTEDMGMPDEAAKDMARSIIPNLKRWERQD